MLYPGIFGDRLSTLALRESLVAFCCRRHRIRCLRSECYYKTILQFLYTVVSCYAIRSYIPRLTRNFPEVVHVRALQHEDAGGKRSIVPEGLWVWQDFGASVLSPPPRLRID